MHAWKRGEQRMRDFYAECVMVGMYAILSITLPGEVSVVVKLNLIK